MFSKSRSQKDGWEFLVLLAIFKCLNCFGGLNSALARYLFFMDTEILSAWRSIVRINETYCVL